MKKSGLFIVFEGGEAAGKSTQIRYLVSRLQSNGVPHLVTREPGGTELGEKVRELLLHSSGNVSPRAELLLYEAARAQHIAERIGPALEAGQWVICDRFQDSSLVYQGICRGLGISQVGRLNQFATGRLDPDLVFVFDLPLKVSLQRLSQRDKLDRLEREGQPFHDKVRKGFRRIALKNTRRYAILDAEKDEKSLSEEIWLRIQKKRKVQ